MKKNQLIFRIKISLLTGLFFLCFSNCVYSDCSACPRYAESLERCDYSECSNLKSHSEYENIQFYAGIDGQLRYSRGKSGYAQILNRSYNLVSLYVGLQLKPIWGLEFGRLVGDKKKRVVYLGEPISPIDGLGFIRSGVKITSYTKFREYFLDSLWTLPFSSDWSYIFILGVLQTKPEILLNHNGIVEHYTGQCRLLLRGGMGIRWFMQDYSDGLALRIILRGSNFRRSRIKLNSSSSSHKIVSKPFRNGFSLDVGLQWYF